MSQRSLGVLHCMLSITATSAPYNEHCLAARGDRRISILTYYAPKLMPDAGMRLFHGGGSPLGFVRALTAALRAGPYDIVHVHAAPMALVMLVATALVPRRRAGRLVYTVHNSYQNYRRRNQRLMAVPFATFGRVVCCSYGVLDSLPGWLRSLGGERVRVVQNGVDLDRVDAVLDGMGAAPPAVVPAAPFTVISVSRLIPIKRPDTVLEAFHRCDDGASRLVFVGRGDLSDAVAAQSRALGIQDRVTLTGLVPRDQVYRSIAAADVFVSASLGEGLPVAALEAMASGCPVILSDIPPHREIASAGSDCVTVVPSGDVEGFAQAIDRFRRLAPEERRRIGTRCRRLVEQRFSLRAMHRRYADVYAEVCVNGLRELPVDAS